MLYSFGVQMMMFRSLFSFFFVTVIFTCSFAFEATASVIGAPQCVARLSIESKGTDHIVGTVKDVKRAQFFSGADCTEFEGKRVKVSVNDRRSNIDTQAITSVKLGVQRGSSMGPDGPVMFLHWEVLGAMTTGGALPSEQLYMLGVEPVN